MNLKLFKRFGFYLIGFGMGIIIVMFFFNNRGCSWMPENRVKNIISERTLICDSITYMKIKSYGINKNNILNLIDDSDVDFSNSKKDGFPKIYKLTLSTTKGEKDCYFLLFDKTFFCELFLTKKEITEIPQHLLNKSVLSIPTNGNYIPSLSNKDRSNPKLNEIQINKQKDLINKLNNNIINCNIKLDEHEKNKYMFQINLNKRNKNATLEFIGDDKQLIFSKIYNMNNKK